MKAPFEGAIENIELVLGFAIDSSGSMSWNDPAGLRKQTAKEFVDKMDENDKAAVIDFDDTAKINCALTNDKTAIKNAIDRIYSSGGTDLGEGVRMALTQLQKNTSKAKFIIMLTDGEGSYNHNLTQEAINEGVKIYTIGLGSNIDVNLLKNIEEATGGKYYHASTASDLSGIFEQTSEETIDLTKDEDHVGSNGRTELSNFLIVAANDCGFLTFEEFFDGEFGTDFFNDGITDIALGIGKDTVQSMKAFKEYRILTEKYPNCDFFMTGHSLGGRLVQDVLYEVYDKNDGIFGLFKSDIIEPIHSVTFNALGYNKIQYFSNGFLKKDNISSIEAKLNNYYYKNDLVGEGLGDSVLFERLGTDIGPWIAMDENGKPIVPDDYVGYKISELHGINLFYEDFSLEYPSTLTIY